MKILIISDLHLCDKRNSEAFENQRLERLAQFIDETHCGLVLNLGDTVSRQEFLRPPFRTLEDGYARYLQWRRRLTIPFVECAVDRELSFFARLFGQAPDSVCTLLPELTIVTMAPQEGFDHDFTPAQVEFLCDAIRQVTSPRVLVATHVPYPGSCSRPITPGTFLDIPERVRELVENSATQKFYWCGGHFHWDAEEPRVFGSLTAFHGGRFCFDSILNKGGWLRTFDSQTGEINLALPDFYW